MLTLAGLPNFPKAVRCINGVGAFADHLLVLDMSVRKGLTGGQADSFDVIVV